MSMRHINQKRILLMVADEGLRAFLGGMLSGEDYQVIVAHAVGELPDLLGKKYPDVVLLRLPNKERAQALEAIGIIQPNLPVIIVSEERDEGATKNAGAVTWLEVPASIERVLTCISETLLS
jgi:DNA-binding NtrC family response regulator